MRYMKKYYVSDYWNKGIKGHLNYAFVDVVVNDDNLLFIDPILLETARDRWCQGANATVQSFFNAFYEAYRTKDQVKKRNCYRMQVNKMEPVWVMVGVIMERGIRNRGCSIFFLH